MTKMKLLVMAAVLSISLPTWADTPSLDKVESWDAFQAAFFDSGVEGVKLMADLTQPDYAFALELSGSRSFTIDLNGWTLTASNQLMIAANSCTLTICDSSSGTNGLLRGHSIDYGGLICVQDSARLVAHDLNLSGSSSQKGGAVSFQRAAEGSFERCTFTDCFANHGAGAVSIESKSSVEFVSCRFSGCSAPTHGVVILDEASVTLRDCSFVGNRIDDSCLFFVTHADSLSLDACQFIGNTLCNDQSDDIYSILQIQDSPNCHLTDCLIAGNDSGYALELFSSSSCTLTNCWFFLNTEDLSGESGHTHTIHLEDSTVSFTGGLIDDTPWGSPWIADGFSLLTQHDPTRYSVVRSGTLVSDPSTGEIEEGDFAFDPTVTKSLTSPQVVSKQLLVASDTTLTHTNDWYEVRPARTIQVDASEFHYLIKNETAVITSMTGPSADTWQIIQVPSLLEGYPVVIRANVFAAYAEKGCALEFDGNPPTADSGAIPSTASVYYPKSHFEAWKAVSTVQVEGTVTNLIWNGVSTLPDPYVRSWDDLETAVASQVSKVEILSTLVQPEGRNALDIRQPFAIHFNGHDIVTSNRLAIVSAGGVLSLVGSVPDIGGTLRGGCTTDYGGIVRVDAGGEVSGTNLVFSGAFIGGEGYTDEVFCGGGAVAVMTGGKGSFACCRFENCRSQRDGGALFTAQGTLDVLNCSFVGNKASWGGAVNTASSNSVFKGCLFTGNYANAEGGAFYVGDWYTLSMSDCIITNNTSPTVGKAGVHLRWGASCTVTNTLIAGNLSAGSSPSSICFVGGLNSVLSFTGGALDAKPTREDGSEATWAAEGFEPFTLNGYWSVAAADTFQTNDLGQITWGVFDFDLTAAPYAGIFPLSATSIFYRLEESLNYYVVYEPVVEEVCDGYRLVYYMRDGVAMLGDGTNSAVRVDGDAELPSVITIPKTVRGLPVGISTNAFVNYEGKNGCLNFLGAPPTEVEAGAFPVTGVYVCYPTSQASAWQAASTEQTEYYLVWQGLYAIESPYVSSWDELAAAVANPAVSLARLIKAVVQPSGGEALTIGTNFVIDLNGHDLIASNRLAIVEADGFLDLMDSAPTKGAAIRGGCNEGPGGLIRVVSGGTVEAYDVTFSDAFVGPKSASYRYEINSGGAVAIRSGHARFSDCRFVNCYAHNMGGAIDCRDGSLILDNCELKQNEAFDGGAISVMNGQFTLTTSELIGNTAQAGSAIYADVTSSTYELADSVISNNYSEVRYGGTVFLTGSGLLKVNNTLVCNNTDCTSRRVSFRAMHNILPLSVSGGVLDVKPDRWSDKYGDVYVDFPWVANGFAEFQQGSYWSVAVTNSLLTNTVGQICKGQFAFDPTVGPCASYLKLHPDVRVKSIGTSSPLYDVRIENGGPYTTTVNQVQFTYRIVNGYVYLGDGIQAAVSSAPAILTVPAELNGYPVYGISANAFSSLSTTNVFLFPSVPPTVVAEGAFPAGASFRYSMAHEEAWKSVIVNGRWEGMTVRDPYCDSWATVRQVLASGQTAQLGVDLTASEGTLELTDATLKPTLDFAGCTIHVASSLAQVLHLTNGAKLTLMDSIGGGGFSGDKTVRTSTTPVFNVEYGTLTHTGGLLQEFYGTCPLVQVAANGAYKLDGGVILGCQSAGVASAGLGFVLDLAGGWLDLTHGGIMNCTSTSAATPLVSIRDGGRCDLRGGYVMTCTVTADSHLFALSSDTATLTFYGSIVASNKRGETTVADDVNTKTGVIVYGGAFDLAPQTLAQGMATFSVPSPSLKRDILLVARAGTVALAQGVLTAGDFAFDPTDKASYSLYLPMPDPSMINLTYTAGNPERWRFAVTYKVTCDTIDDLRANLLVGNEAILTDKIIPESTGYLPEGFVYRAAVLDGDNPATGSIAVKLKLYSVETGGTPVWSGHTTVTPKSEGVFQIWVDDALRDTDCSRNLADVFAAGEAVYLGVTFADGDECLPRRNLVSVPLVSRAAKAAGLDDEASATLIYAPTGTVTCGELTLADGGLCTTLEITATNAAYNVSEMDVGGFTLYRHAENRILSSKDSDWVRVSIKPGDALVERARVSGLLTIKSDDGDTVPLLTVPIPAGGSFIWQSTAFEGACRWTRFGESN